MTSARKDKIVLNMYALLQELTIATCDKCKTEASLDGDAASTADVFYKEGWRATENNLYCKKCAKKYLKK